MPQLNIFFDNSENKIIEQYAKQWKLSKAETVKKIVKNFKEETK